MRKFKEVIFCVLLSLTIITLADGQSPSDDLKQQTSNNDNRKQNNRPSDRLEQKTQVGSKTELPSKSDSRNEENRNERPKDSRVKYGKLPKESVLLESQCKDDIRQFCPKSLSHSDMGILDCLQTDDNIVKQLSKACHHTIWQYKKNLTDSKYFNHATGGVCEEDLKLSACHEVDEKFIISCLVDQKEKIQNKQCFKFLNRVATIIFADYRLVYNFVKQCDTDIAKLNCGRVQASNRKNENGNKKGGDSDEDDDEDDMTPTSQGETIECLMANVTNLNRKCAKEVLRVAELQSDDFHLDRQLFYACREDRELLCSDVAAGEGRVYKCLMKHVFHPKMSGECKTVLETREKVIQEDSKADYSFFEHCKQSIQKYKCDTPNAGEETVNHASTMLCLEAQEKNEPESLPAECKAQLMDWRQTLLSDYKISPEVVRDCHTMLKSCSKFVGEPGGVIHCLLEIAKKSTGSESESGENGLPAECLRSLEDLIKVADPGSDIEVDPVIHSVCHEDITKMCSTARRGHGDVYECLLRHFADDDNAGSAECREKVMELAYIIARDYKFNDKLFTACKKDAVKLCDADKDWYNKAGKATVSKDHVAFNCLHNRLREVPSYLSKACSNEIRHVLYYSRGRIELEPWLYEPCFKDLVAKCPNHDSPGDKQKCLQDNLDQLKEECREAVNQFTSDAQLDLQLDAIAYRACKTVAPLLCKDEMEADKEMEEGQLLQCMAEHKYAPEMTSECRAVINHYQILTLKDIKGSPRLMRACRVDYEKHCKDSKTGDEVVKCLSEIKLRNKILPIKNAESGDENEDQPNDSQLTSKCAAELKFELLQRSTNYKLDPELEKNCGADVKQFCSDIKPGKRRIINCLENHRKNLSDACHVMLFQREKELANNQRTDKLLIDTCDSMIQKHCPHIDHPKRGLIRCLAKHLRTDSNFDAECKTILVRRMKVRNLDIRLHPLLKKACKKDISERCSHVTAGKKDDSPKEYNGRVIQCLKLEYVKSTKTGKALQNSCEDHIRDVIINANLMHHLDPILVGACGHEIKDKCNSEALSSDGDQGDGAVANCLKKAFIHNKIQDKSCQQEILRLMGESRADVHVDPVLYRACSAELRTVCGSVVPGAGRQMSCLLSARSDKEALKHMSRNCIKELKSRVDMWEMAAKLAPPESFSELLEQVTTSGSRNYLLAVISVIILGIFIFGLCFGRVTKRVLVQEKNK